MKSVDLISVAVLAMATGAVAQTPNLFVYLLLQQQQALANHRRQQELTRQSAPSWNEWGKWSTCTSTAQNGMRVRSRSCEGSETCDELEGDNYQVETCSHKGTHNMDPDIVNQCENDDAMKNSMSCKLYMENSTLAYDIYVTTGCIMNVLDDSNYKGDESKFVFGRPAETRTGEVSAMFDTFLETQPMTTGRISSTNQQPAPQGDVGQPENRGLSAYINNLFCLDSCQRVVVMATGVSSVLTRAPLTIDGVLSLLATRALLGSSSAISSEYSTCIAECQLFGVQYAFARLDLASRGQDRTQLSGDLQVSPLAPPVVLPPAPPTPPITGKRRRRSVPLITARGLTLSYERFMSLRRRLANARRGGFKPTGVPKTTKSQRTKPTTASLVAADNEDKNATKLRGRITGKRPKPARIPDPGVLAESADHHNISAILVRGKRQAPISPASYTNPCFATEEISRDPRVRNMDDTRGELFFFERRRQRFLRRNCAGPAIVSGALFQPNERVMVERTQDLAICKQGFLPRFGLMIFYDDEGEYAFQDGRRFSVKLKQFKLESNCELSVSV